MKKLLFLLLALTVSAPAFAQTQTQYYTVPTIAALKAMTTSRPAVVQVVDATPGIFNMSAGACTAADDVMQVQPTSGTTVCYRRMVGPLVASVTPGNSYLDLFVPLNGSTFVDNVISIKNSSVGVGGPGNAALRFLAGDGTNAEWAAIGYSHPDSQSGGGFYPSSLYAEIGNVPNSAVTTDYTGFIVVNTHKSNSPAPYTGLQYKPFEVDWDGNIYFRGPAALTGYTVLGVDTVNRNIEALADVKIGELATPRLLSMPMETTIARLRERVADDMFAITTNISDAGFLDNVATSAWQTLMGGNYDRFTVSRASAGAGARTFTDIFSVDAAGVVDVGVGGIAVGRIGNVQQASVGMTTTNFRAREKTAGDNFSLTTNLTNAGTQDNAAAASWAVQFGNNPDEWSVSRAPAGSVVLAKYLSVSATTTTVGNALTYGGVTLSNSVTGTGSMALSASPTFTGTVTTAALSVGAVGNVQQATVGLSATLGRFREWDNADDMAWTVNANISNASDDTGKTSWKVRQGPSNDNFTVWRAPATAGTVTWANMLTLSSAGALSVPSTITATLANTATTSAVCYNTGTGLFTYNSTVGTCTVSALSYKVPGQPIANGKALASLVTMRTDGWTYKKLPGLDDREHVGLYADDVAKLDKRCAIYKDGKIENYDDRCVLAYTIAAMKELKAGNDNLKTEIEQLKKKVK